MIAHAFLESGYGTSNFASGRYGAYNYFGIGAFDNDPDYAMKFAKNKGWTTPAKAIMGGASFVRKDYINKGRIHCTESDGILRIQLRTNTLLL